MNKSAITLITYKPNEIFLDFLNIFKKYDVFVIIDDNSINYDYLKSKYININILQIDNHLCSVSGFINSNSI